MTVAHAGRIPDYSLLLWDIIFKLDSDGTDAGLGDRQGETGENSDILFLRTS